MQDWIEILGNISMAQMARGLNALQVNPPKYPPGAAEFAASCRDKYENAERARAKQLPSQAAVFSSNATGKAWRALMIVDGHMRRPEGVTDDELDEALSGYNRDDMRRQMKRQTEATLKRFKAIA